MSTDPSRVAMSGPLMPFAAGFAAELAGRGPGVVAVHLRLMAHLSRWLEAQALGQADLELAAIGAFVVACHAAGCSSGRTPGRWHRCWANPAGGLAVHRHRPQPVPGQRLRLPGGTPGTVVAHAGRRRPAGACVLRWRGPSSAWGQGTGSNTIQDNPDRLLI